MGPGVGLAHLLGTGRAVRLCLPPGSPRCRPTITLRAPSGTLTHSSSPSSTQHGTSMTPSSCEVGGPCCAIRGARTGQNLLGWHTILQDKLHPPQCGRQACVSCYHQLLLSSSTSPPAHLRAFARAVASAENCLLPGLHGRLWHEASVHISPQRGHPDMPLSPQVLKAPHC